MLPFKCRGRLRIPLVCGLYVLYGWRGRSTGFSKNFIQFAEALQLLPSFTSSYGRAGRNMSRRQYMYGSPLFVVYAPYIIVPPWLACCQQSRTTIILLVCLWMMGDARLGRRRIWLYSQCANGLRTWQQAINGSRPIGVFEDSHGR